MILPNKRIMRNITKKPPDLSGKPPQGSTISEQEDKASELKTIPLSNQ